MQKKILFGANCIRTIPVYLSYKGSNQRKEIKMDLDRWKEITSDRVIAVKNDLFLMNRLLMTQEPFRNLIQMRLKKPPFTIKSIIHYGVARILWKPLNSLYISTYEIGGGLFIQHGFSIVAQLSRQKSKIFIMN